MDMHASDGGLRVVLADPRTSARCCTQGAGSDGRKVEEMHFTDYVGGVVVCCDDYVWSFVMSINIKSKTMTPSLRN